jgi:uncharacterized protein (DUF1684 family)
MSRASVEAHRAERNRIFREGKTSPLTDEQKEVFDGLTYFEHSKELDLTLRVERLAEPEALDVRTTKDDVRTYQRYGTVRFEAGGVEVCLTIYKTSHGFFLPFVDGGAGETTHGAGRYLDPEQVDEDTFHLDFNLVYNPLCAYNDLWNCPLVPLENHTKARIEAGERIPEGPWARPH